MFVLGIEMKKVLFLATYGDFLATFEYSNILLWQSLGVEVHCASNFAERKYNLKTNRLKKSGVILHELHFDRKPFSCKNLKSFKKLKKIISSEHIDIIDCHNAVVGAYARIASWQCGIKKIIYSPHGFFFYKGSPKKNEIFKLVETSLSRITDLLITINEEDYNAAKKMPIRGKAIYVPGIGIDTNNIKKIPNMRVKYHRSLGIPDNSKVYISVGELISRKDHETAIRAFAKANLKDSYYVIAGIGALEPRLKELINKLNMTKKIFLLGYRLDAKDLMKSSDVFIFPSRQEGLPVALMEAMACGLPCLVSKIRGNVDLIDEEQGGYLFKAGDVNDLQKKLLQFNRISPAMLKNMKQYNEKKIEMFDIKNVRKIMLAEYRALLNRN